MMRIIVLLYALVAPLMALSQTRKAELEIKDFRISNATYHLDCSIKYTAPARPDMHRYLVFFIRSEPGRLYSVKIKGADGLQDYFLTDEENDDYQVSLLPQQHFRNQRFSLYAVLLEGNYYALEKSLSLIDGEFETIKDVLNVFYKSEQMPLTYALFER
jgi:hypothetical protein